MTQQRRVLGLDDGRPLCSRNVLRALPYLDKQAGLSEGELIRLRIIEEMLYCSYRGASNPCIGLRKFGPTAFFSCDEGSIKFNFSPSIHKYVLLDFEINDGGSGGITNPTLGPRPAAVGRTTHSFAAIKRAVGCLFSIAEGVTRLLCAPPSAKHALQHFESLFLVTYLLSGCKWMKNTGLPSWSLLSPFIIVPEQIQNRFARSIIAGELICHKSREMYLSSRRKLDRRENYADTRLLRESRLMIEYIMASRAKDVNPRFSCFVTASLLNKDILGDDKRLSLIGNELVLTLSVSLARQIRAANTGARDASDLRILRKLSLLSEFACLSREYFGDQHFCWSSSKMALREARDISVIWRSRYTQDFVCLSDFGHFTTTIVDQLEAEERAHKPRSNKIDPLGRMIEVASEILAPMRARNRETLHGLATPLLFVADEPDLGPKKHPERS